MEKYHDCTQTDGVRLWSFSGAILGCRWCTSLYDYNARKFVLYLDYERRPHLRDTIQSCVRLQRCRSDVAGQLQRIPSFSSRSSYPPATTPRSNSISPPHVRRSHRNFPDTLQKPPPSPAHRCRRSRRYQSCFRSSLPRGNASYWPTASPDSTAAEASLPVPWVI